MARNETMFDMTTLVANLVIPDKILQHYTKKAFINAIVGAYAMERAKCGMRHKLGDEKWLRTVTTNICDSLMRRVVVKYNDVIELRITMSVSEILHKLDAFTYQPLAYLYGSYGDVSIDADTIHHEIELSLYSLPAFIREITICGKKRVFLTFVHEDTEALPITIWR